MPQLSRFQLMSTFLFILLFASVLFLFFSQFFLQKFLKVRQLPSDEPSSTPITAATTLSVSESEQLSNLQASLASVSARLEALEQQTNQQVTAPKNTITQQTAAALKKETLYLGSASTQHLDWQDTGLEVMINANDYPATTNVWYEAGMSIVGGQSWSRLKNKTTGAIINTSEIYAIGSSTTWISSSAFKLHPGTNSYVVQLRSTSGEVANLAGARIILSW